MLKIAIENSYIDKYCGKDEFWAKIFMQEIFKKNDIELVRVSMNKMNKKNEFTEYNIFTKDRKAKVIKKIYKPDIIEINASPGTRYYQENQKELEKICKWLISFFKWLKK